jgi:hypothetical protein
MELISCDDCGWSVSFSAACPNCGSREPSGPYRHNNRKEARRLRIEEKNDKNLIIVMTALGAVGAFYGFETSSNSLGALMLGFCYGFVGVVIGEPLAFAINITRNWR